VFFGGGKKRRGNARFTSSRPRQGKGGKARAPLGGGPAVARGRTKKKGKKEKEGSLLPGERRERGGTGCTEKKKFRGEEERGVKKRLKYFSYVTRKGEKVKRNSLLLEEKEKNAPEKKPKPNPSYSLLKKKERRKLSPPSNGGKRKEGKRED